MIVRKRMAVIWVLAVGVLLVLGWWVSEEARKSPPPIPGVMHTDSACGC